MSNKKKRNLLKEQESDSEEEEIKIPDKNAETFYCIVPGCKEESVWTAKASLINHLNTHLSGRLRGKIPQAFFRQWKFTTCSVCARLLSASNSQGSHPNCRKNQSQPLSSSSSSIPAPIKLSDIHSHPFLQTLSWKRIFKLESISISFLPKSISGRWGSILCTTLRSVLHRKDVNAWKLFCLLPRLVLRQPKRGGSNKFANMVDKNMKRWQEGDLEKLFLDAEQVTFERRSNNKKQDFKRSFRLCSLGRYSDALRALEETEFVSETDSNLAKLRKLHPAKSDVKTKTFTTSSISISSESLLLDCLKSFPKGSAPGLDGYRAEHLIDACNTTQNVSLLTIITNFTNMILSGNIPLEVREWLGGGRLCALPKKDGGIRPICMGSVWRRLASKVICSMMQPKFSTFLAPNQLGVAVKSGSEVLIHQVDLLYRAGKNLKNFVILKIDWKNAFNSIDRQLFLDSIYEHFPEIYNYIAAMYGVKGRLKFGKNFIFSEEGTQQGDPMGPVLFSIALKLLIDKLDSKNLTLNKWYLDDGNLAGKVKFVAKAYKTLVKEGKKIGLEMGDDKCELFYPSGSNFKRGLFPLKLKIMKGGIVTIGAPIGSDEFLNRFFNQRYNKLDLLLAKLKNASSSIGSQCTYILLSKCLSFCRMVYHARTIHPSLVISHAIKYDQLIQDCFSLLIPGLKDDELTQCTFPLKSGGMGLRRLSDHCVPAFLASAAVSLKHLKSDLASADEHWNLKGLILNFNAEIDSDNITWNTVTDQRSLSAMIEKNQLKQFKAGLIGDNKHRFSALSGELSSSWLSAVPDYCNRLTSAEFETAVRLRLGADIYKDESTCDFCGGKRAADKKGLHGLVCKGGGDRISRHNALRDLLVKLCSEACFSLEPVVVEKKWLIAGSKARPADLFIPAWNGGKGLAIDVTVTSPLQSAYSSSYIPGLAATIAADKKVIKYDSVSRSSGFELMPFAMECFGILDTRATYFLSTLMTRLSTRRGQPLTVTSANVCRTLSIALHRSIARSVLKRKKEPDDDKLLTPPREINNPVTISLHTTPHKAIIPTLSDFLKSARSNNSRADKKEKKRKLENTKASCRTSNDSSPSDSSSSVANITPDTAPLILEIQSSTEETQDGSSDKNNSSDQRAITSFTSEIHDLQYSDSSFNNSSTNISILERMDLLELKLLEAQKDLAEFDGNLNAVSHRTLPAMEPLDISISPIMSPIRSTGNYRALTMKEQD